MSLETLISRVFLPKQGRTEGYRYTLNPLNQ